MEQLHQLQQSGMEQLDACLLPVSAALAQFPQLELSAGEGLDISHGRPVNLDTTVAPGIYRLHSSEGQFLGLGEVLESAQLKAKRLMNTER